MGKSVINDHFVFESEEVDDSFRNPWLDNIQIHFIHVDLFIRQFKRIAGGPHAFVEKHSGNLRLRRSFLSAFGALRKSATNRIKGDRDTLHPVPQIHPGRVSYIYEKVTIYFVACTHHSDAFGCVPSAKS